MKIIRRYGSKISDVHKYVWERQDPVGDRYFDESIEMGTRSLIAIFKCTLLHDDNVMAASLRQQFMVYMDSENAKRGIWTNEQVAFPTMTLEIAVVNLFNKACQENHDVAVDSPHSITLFSDIEVCGERSERVRVFAAYAALDPEGEKRINYALSGLFGKAKLGLLGNKPSIPLSPVHRQKVGEYIY